MRRRDLVRATDAGTLLPMFKVAPTAAKITWIIFFSLESSLLVEKGIVLKWKLKVVVNANFYANVALENVMALSQE